MNKSSTRRGTTRPASFTPQYIMRFMTRSDLPKVLEIERERWPDEWSEQTFHDHLMERNVMGYVVELTNPDPKRDSRIVGFCLLGCSESALGILNLGVCLLYRRRGVCRLMVNRMIQKLVTHDRRRLVATVPDNCLEFQLALRAHGFRAEQVLRNHFGDGTTRRDGYLMAYERKDGAA